MSRLLQPARAIEAQHTTTEDQLIFLTISELHTLLGDGRPYGTAD